MTRASTNQVPLGLVAQDLWKVILELHRDVQCFLKDEAKNKEQQQKDKRKKAKAKAKKKARKGRKRWKQDDPKTSKMLSDSFRGLDSTNELASTSSGESSSDSLCDSESSSGYGKKLKTQCRGE